MIQKGYNKRKTLNAFRVSSLPRDTPPQANGSVRRETFRVKDKIIMAILAFEERQERSSWKRENFPATL